MSGLLVCPECPDCGSRQQKLRFDTDRDVGVIRCGECGADMLVVAVLANKTLQTVKDPAAGELPDGVYDELADTGRLPPVATADEGVEIDVE